MLGPGPGRAASFSLLHFIFAILFRGYDEIRSTSFALRTVERDAIKVTPLGRVPYGATVRSSQHVSGAGTAYGPGYFNLIISRPRPTILLARLSLCLR